MDASTTGGMDASTNPQATATVGTGEQGFVALSEGDTVEFILGSQSTGDPMGGFHVWGAVETDGIDPDNPTVTFQVFDQASGNMVAEATRTRTFLPTGQGTHTFFGVALILSDCCQAIGSQMRIEVEVVDKNNVSASDSVVITGGQICPDGNQQNVCP